MKWLWWLVGGGILLTLLNRERVVGNLKDVRLGPNFTLDEFVKTSTGIENIPGEKEIQNLKYLVQYILQPLRDIFATKYRGKKVVLIPSSGYRAPSVNSAVPGSSKTSQHMTGQAADFSIYVDGQRVSNQEVIDEARRHRLPFDQLIDEQLKGKQWIHASYVYPSPNRNQWLTARDDGQGGTTYQTIKYGFA